MSLTSQSLGSAARSSGQGSSFAADAQAGVAAQLVLTERHDVWLDRALQDLHGAVLALLEVHMDEPALVVHLGVVEPMVIQPPAALLAVHRGARRHLRAVADEVA